MKTSVLLADIFQSKLLPDKLCFVLVQHLQSFVPVQLHHCKPNP